MTTSPTLKFRKESSDCDDLLSKIKGFENDFEGWYDSDNKEEEKNDRTRYKSYAKLFDFPNAEVIHYNVADILHLWSLEFSYNLSKTNEKFDYLYEKVSACLEGTNWIENPKFEKEATFPSKGFEYDGNRICIKSICTGGYCVISLIFEPIYN